MGKTAEEVLLGLLSTSLKLDDTGVTSLKEEDGSFKDDALEHLTKLDADRVAALRGDIEKVRSERYSQGKREAMEALEKELRGEFGIKDTDKRGKDLVKAIVAERIKAAEAMPEEKVKAHPLYIQLEEQLQAVPKTLEEKLKEREEALKTEFRHEQLMARLLEEGNTLFDAMNPVLSEDPVKARNQRKLLNDYLRGHKYNFAEKDGELTIIPLKADGSRLEDSHGHPVSFKDLLEQGARQFYDFHKGERKHSAPDPGKNGSGSGSGTDGSWKLQTQSDYAKAWKEIDDSQEDFASKREKWNKLKEAGRAAGVVS